MSVRKLSEMQGLKTRQSMSFKIIISCCGKKRNHPCRANQIYISSLFKAGYAWAESITISDNIFIISAKYGLIKSNEIIEPYNLQMGDKGSIDVELLKKQAHDLSLMDQNIYLLAGSKYIDRVNKIGLRFHNPLKGMTVGYRMYLLKKNIGKIPRWSNDSNN